MEGNSRAGIIDLETDGVRWIGDGAPITFLDRETVVLDDPARLYTLDTGSTHGIEIDGSVGDEMAADGVRLGSRRILFTQSAERRPSELFVYDRETGSEHRLVAAEFRPIDPDSLVAATAISYESVAGRIVDGLLYRPPEASPETPVPVIVEAHGFPTEVSRGFKPEVQFLVSRGYAVVQPNYRGATNRSAGFPESIEGDWGGAEQDDIAAAADWVAEQEWGDDDRVAIYGHSFGGFTAYTQLVRYPETWTVGVASGGITDLHLLDGLKGGDELLRSQMGDPGDNAALWRDRSPITHVENVERPLLILHGTNDPTTPLRLAQAFKGALEADRDWTEGEEFEYEPIETGEHGNLDTTTNTRRWKLLLDFLERRL